MGARSEAVRIWLLGDFKVSVGSRSIEKSAWRLKKAAALLKLLALAPDHRLHREQGMDLLWPNSGGRAASNSLRQTLHAARRTLDPTMGSRYLVSENEHLLLCPQGQLWVDVDAFEEAAATARSAREPAHYRAALDHYGGDLLPEDRYEAWAEGRREELRRLYLALLVELAMHYEERGEHRLGIEALTKATAKEPTLEQAHASIMRLHALLGSPEKALAQYERLCKALHRNLATEPGAATRRLRDEIAAGKLRPTPPASPVQEEKTSDSVKHNLPAARTSFVGREQEMVEVKRALAMTRLLTLTGAGGTGKTRLSIEVARHLVGTYPDGVRLVELAPISELELVAQEVANVLGVQERPGEPLMGTLLEALAGKEMLLVVDNCEHVVDGAARLVDTLLASCPRLKVLATSREPLGVYGEVNSLVPPLSLPDHDGAPTVESLMRYEAVRLFLDRSRLRLPDFGLTQENAPAVSKVCRRLEGIPLAIELATARMGVLAVEQVAQRLEVSLDVLKDIGRTTAPRQRTLRATLDWSHNLLSEVERALFRRLSVFAGGWTLEAAEAVCSGEGIEHGEVLDLLERLVDKSLVVVQASSGGAARYRMLEPIRQYARDKLEESGEAEELRSSHATFYLVLAEEAEPGLAGAQQSTWVERLEGEHDNLREALAWILEWGKAELGLRFGGALWRFWHARGYLSEGTRWLERVLAEGEPVASPARVKALEGMGWLSQFRGDQRGAKAAYEEMLTLARELDDKGNIATALNSLGTVAAQQGDNERAKALLQENLGVIDELERIGDPATPLKKYFLCNLLGYLAINDEGDHVRGATLWEESLALAREVADDYLIGTSLTSLGHVALLQRDFDRAKAHSQEALAFAHELGSAGVEVIPSNLINLGLASLGLGEHERALGAFKEALAKVQDTGRTPQVLETLEGMASLAGAVGKASRAAHIWGAAEAAREATGINVFTPDEWALHEPHLAAARYQMGMARWEEALVEGRAMSLEEAVEYALSGEETDPPTNSEPENLSIDQPPFRLTPRERDVALLVARGLTNRQIASELSISERTSASHVSNILKKLGLKSRAQIAAWATEHWLLPRPDQD